MPGSISDFRASFDTDISRSNRFNVNIPIPLALTGTTGADSRNLSFRCETADLPSRNLMTMDKKIGSAPIEKFPYHTSYGESTMTFIVSDDMREKIFFDSWLDIINPTTDYNFQYKSNYATDITINQYNVNNQLTYSVVLRDAFPLAINQLDLEWSSESYHKLEIQFVYTNWINNYSNALQQKITNAGLTGLINTITQ